METVLQDMVRWLIGFGIVSALYLAVGLWLIGRCRNRQSVQDPATAPSVEDPPERRPPDLASHPDATGETSES